MSESELYTLLSTLKYPVAYDHFTTKTVSIPLYRNTDAQTFKADDINYNVSKQYIVDLITAKKEPDVESSLEKVFDDNYLPYEKSEDYIESEQIYQIRYFI